MYKRSGLFFALMAWVSVCGAQVILAPGFGEELGKITWQSWAWAMAFASVGIMARVDRSKRDKEIETDIFGIVSWTFVGILAALIAFGICEWVNKTTGHRMYDWIEGGIIALSGYNRREVIDLISDKLKRFVDGWAATNGAK